MDKDIVERLRNNTELEFDYTIDLQEEAAAEIERLRRALAKDPNTIMIAYESGTHQKISRAYAKLLDENEKLKEALAFADEHSAKVEDLLWNALKEHTNLIQDIKQDISND